MDSLREVLARSPRPLHLLGEGIPYHERFIPRDDPAIVVTPPELWRARAAAVAKVAIPLDTRGEYADPFTLIPIYIRRPEAEEKFGTTDHKPRTTD